MDKVKYREYQKQYCIKYLERVSLSLSKINDTDIIEAIKKEGKRSKQANIKSLIRKGMKYNAEREDTPVLC